IRCPLVTGVQTCALPIFGTKKNAITRATTASGKVRRKTDPHQKCSSSSPDSSGPSAEIPPPMPDQSAIDFVRPGPDQSAVIKARDRKSVVQGKTVEQGER